MLLLKLLSKLCHITAVLRSFHWLKISECIKYKLLSLTYKVLTTNQPPYLHHLISVQPPRSTRSSSLVTLARPPTSSSLHITDRSFQYASPCLWNQLPSSLHQPHSSFCSVSDFPVHAPTTSSFSFNSPLTIHNSLSLSLPAQDLPSFTSLSHHRLPSFSVRTDSTDFEWTVSSEHLVFLFLVSSLLVFVWFHAAN